MTTSHAPLARTELAALLTGAAQSVSRILAAEYPTTGSRHGDPYVLTDAGRALGPIYAAVKHWSNPVTTREHSAPPAPVAPATRTPTGVSLASDRTRSTAALRRSTTVPSTLFSHAPQPQPRVPAAATAQSAPSQGR